MPVQGLERCIKQGLTEREVDRLPALGPAPVRWAVLEMSARWREDREFLNTAQMESPVTAPGIPSGQVPIYKKPNRETRRRRKPGAKEGIPEKEERRRTE